MIKGKSSKGTLQPNEFLGIFSGKDKAVRSTWPELGKKIMQIRRQLGLQDVISQKFCH